MKAVIDLGRKEFSSAVLEALLNNPEFQNFVDRCLRRHASGDWGNLSPADEEANDLTIKENLYSQVISSYDIPPGIGIRYYEILIETDLEDAERVTRIIFPHEI